MVHFSNIWLIFTETDGLLVVDMGQNGQDMGQNSFLAFLVVHFVQEFPRGRCDP